MDSTATGDRQRSIYYRRLLGDASEALRHDPKRYPYIVLEPVGEDET